MPFVTVNLTFFSSLQILSTSQSLHWMERSSSARRGPSSSSWLRQLPVCMFVTSTCPPVTPGSSSLWPGPHMQGNSLKWIPVTRSSPRLQQLLPWRLQETDCRSKCKLLLQSRSCPLVFTSFLIETITGTMPLLMSPYARSCWPSGFLECQKCAFILWLTSYPVCFRESWWI